MSEPHAVVKVRLAYHSAPGPQLAQTVMHNEARVEEIPTPVVGGDGVVNRPVLVRPQPVTWTISSNFFHTVTTTSLQTVMVSRSYPCGRSTCTTSSPQTRTVTRTVMVSDGSCRTALAQYPQGQGVYLLQYDFFAHGHCTLRCFRQSPAPDGTAVNGPCEPAPPVAAE